MFSLGPSKEFLRKLGEVGWGVGWAGGRCPKSLALGALGHALTAPRGNHSGMTWEPLGGWLSSGSRVVSEWFPSGSLAAHAPKSPSGSEPAPRSGGLERTLAGRRSRGGVWGGGLGGFWEPGRRLEAMLASVPVRYAALIVTRYGPQPEAAQVHEESESESSEDDSG